MPRGRVLFRSSPSTAVVFCGLVLSLSLAACGSDSASSKGEAAAPDAGADAAPPPRPPAADPTVWRRTGKLATARFSHTATLLPDGRVIVVGGEEELERRMLR